MGALDVYASEELHVGTCGCIERVAKGDKSPWDRGCIIYNFLIENVVNFIV
jgi:hypothetical protein